MDVVILDVESSGLSDESYPIEVGFCTLDQVTTGSFLINPETADGWDYWNYEGEEIYHQLSREELASGLSVQDAANQLNKDFENKTVISDGLEWDSFWIQKLFEAANVEMRFKLLPLSSLTDKADAIYEYLEDRYKEHRAVDDAKQIAEAVKIFDAKNKALNI